MIDKYSNPMQSKPPQRVNPPLIAPSKLNFPEQSNLQSPKFKQYNPFVFNTSPTHTDDYINQTPAFQDKYSNRANHLLYEDQSNERYMIDGENYSQTEAKSQVISIKELDNEFQPSFMANINYNLKRNFKKLLQKKIRNDVDELRMIQSDFVAFVNEQKNVVMEFAGMIGKQMEMSIKKIKNSQQTTNNAELMQEIIEKRKTITSLEAALTQKNQENAKLKKEVNDQKQLMEKQMKKVQSKKSVAESIESSYCNSCKIAEIKQATLKEELSKTEKQIENLLIENEKLQEYIFDIQQKIVGIDIEVEKRLKEHLKILDQNKASAQHHPEIDKEDYVEIMRKLNDQNTALQNKCSLLEKNNMKEHDLRQLEKVLYEQQVEYRRKETELFQSIARHETDKERLYQRQHNVALREEENTKRKQELQKKEAELNSLEEMINNQAEKIFSQTSMPSVQRYAEFKKDSPRVNELTINTFGKILEKNANPPTGVGKTYREGKINKYERIYSQNVFIPELPLTKEQTSYHKHEEMPAQQPHWQSITSPKSTHLSKQKSNELYSNILKKHEKDSKKSLHLASNLTKNSPSHFQQTSMNSRMSANKAILNSYLQNSAVTQERPRERQHTNHLGSKLDKLRSQIKREIQSIK